MVNRTAKLCLKCFKTVNPSLLNFEFLNFPHKFNNICYILAKRAYMMNVLIQTVYLALFG